MADVGCSWLDPQNSSPSVPLLTPADHARPHGNKSATVSSVLLAVAITGATSLLSTAQELPNSQAILQTAHLINNYWQANNGYGDADWDRATYQTGNMELYHLTGNTALRDYATAWGQANNWQIGRADPFHADAYTCGQVYVDLYLENPQPNYLTQMKAALDGTVGSSRVDYWWWIDAFYMAAPTFARFDKLYNNPAYMEKAWALYYDMGWRRGLFDAAEGLWYRDDRFIYPKIVSPNGKKVFWSRGNGWVFAGIARVLDQLPADHPRRAAFETMFQTMAAALLPLQGEDGFWRANLADPLHVPNPETSGTAFFVAGYAWGIRKGLLDEATYLPAVAAGWHGLTTIAMNQTGYVGYIQNIGYDPRAATFASNSDFGIGAMLVAAVEVYHIAEPAPFVVTAGPAKSYPNFGGTPTVLVELQGSAIFESEPEEPATYTWTLDGTILGHGPRLWAHLPNGIHQPRLTVVADGVTLFAETRVEVGSHPYLLADHSSAQVGNPAINVLDGSLDTRWSADGIGQWLLFDFGLPVHVPSLAASFYVGNTRTSSFRIEASLNGTTWSPIGGLFTSSGTTLQPQTFSLPETPPLRFLRFIGQGNSSNAWNSVTTLSFTRTLSKHDSNSDGVPDGWLILHLGSADWNATDDPTGKGQSLLTDYLTGTDPRDPLDRWKASLTTDTDGLRITFPVRGPDFTGASRKYTVSSNTDLAGEWLPLPGFHRITLDPETTSLTLPHAIDDKRFYRIEVDLEP